MTVELLNAILALDTRNPRIQTRLVEPRESARRNRKRPFPVIDDTFQQKKRRLVVSSSRFNQLKGKAMSRKVQSDYINQEQKILESFPSKIHSLTTSNSVKVANSQSKLKYLPPSDSAHFEEITLDILR